MKSTKTTKVMKTTEAMKTAKTTKSKKSPMKTTKAPMKTAKAEKTSKKTTKAKKTTLKTTEVTKSSAEPTKEAKTTTPRVIDFSVFDMAGDAYPYQAMSVKELRIKLAIRAGVFYPCIKLFNRSSYAAMEDTHDMDKIFEGKKEPYEVCVVNNEEGVKKDVASWDGRKWIE